MPGAVLSKGMATMYFAEYRGRSATSQPSYASPVAELAHVEIVDRRIDLGGGSFQVYSHVIICRGAHGVEDLAWIPGRNQADQKQALKVRRVDPIPVGVSAGATQVIDHYEIFIGP